MEIFHIGAECYPFAKVGGLADVIGALPKYQNNTDVQVRVVIPCYQNDFKLNNVFECVHWGKLTLGNFKFPFSVLKEKYNVLGFELYLIEIPELFDRPNIYNYEDDIERFLSFQIAVLDWLMGRNTLPDIIHCHDHHTGLIPFMKNYCSKYLKLKNIITLITIHNGLYQGIFSFNKLNYLPSFDLNQINKIERWNCINSLAAAIKCSDAITTVSMSYLSELKHTDNGLESLFQNFDYKSYGILNGIDTLIWDPSSDYMLDYNYSIATINEGKQKNKEQLCSQFNLNPLIPLICFIGRLYPEKGADLLPKIVSSILIAFKEEINILILGYGDSEIENQLTQLLSFYRGNYNVYIGYNEELAHKTYAGSDFILIPSRIEPCGLNQLYAMRYGTIPIVHRIGGLKDTVVDFEENGNGVCFSKLTICEIDEAIKKAVNLYNDKEKVHQVRIKGMSENHSWENVSKEYIKLYKQLTTTQYEK
jgi:starch synthase